MVKALHDGEFNNITGFHDSYGATVRRVAIQGLVRSPRMVVIQIRRHESLEMPLVEQDDMVESSRRRVPITCSTQAFCHGDAGAVTTSESPRLDWLPTFAQ
jgi:hypothetical protein